MQYIIFGKIYKKWLKKLTFANYFCVFWKGLKGKSKGTLSEWRKNKKNEI